MANFYLQDCRVLIDDTAFAPYNNKLLLKASVDVLDATTFLQSHQVKLPGLRTIEFQQDGFWDSSADVKMFPNLGLSKAVTVCPLGGETTTAYIFQGGLFKYEQFGAIGEVAPFTLAMSSTNGIGLVRGQMAANTRTVSGTGQLGSILTMAGPTATQYIYATLHVRTSATTITVTIESATTLGFAGPTVRATIGPITTTGGTFMTRVLGPVTDGFWRMNVSAITGTFLVDGAIAIQ